MTIKVFDYVDGLQNDSKTTSKCQYSSRMNKLFDTRERKSAADLQDLKFEVLLVVYIFFKTS